MQQFFQAHYCSEQSDVPVDALDRLFWKNINSLLHKHHHWIFTCWKICHLDKAASFMLFTNWGHLIDRDQSCASCTQVNLTRSINSLNNIKMILIIMIILIIIILLSSSLLLNLYHLICTPIVRVLNRRTRARIRLAFYNYSN